MADVSGIMKGFSDTTKPDSFVTNTFPFLAYLTQRLQWWRPHIRHLMEQRDLWMTLLDGLKAKMAAGKGPKCLARDFLTSTDGLKNVDDEQMAFLAGSEYPLLAADSSRFLPVVPASSCKLLHLVVFCSVSFVVVIG